jgi:hypothetical protein
MYKKLLVEDGLIAAAIRCSRSYRSSVFERAALRLASQW